jgi:hypothetical protein
VPREAQEDTSLGTIMKVQTGERPVFERGSSTFKDLALLRVSIFSIGLKLTDLLIYGLEAIVQDEVHVDHFLCREEQSRQNAREIFHEILEKKSDKSEKKLINRTKWQCKIGCANPGDDKDSHIQIAQEMRPSQKITKYDSLGRLKH